MTAENGERSHRCGVVVISPDEDEPNLDCQCGVYRAVNNDEWTAATVRKGDRVRFQHFTGKAFARLSTRTLSDWKEGTVEGSMLYDGICLRVSEVDPDHLIIHNIRPEMGERVERIGASANGGPT